MKKRPPKSKAKDKSQKAAPKDRKPADGNDALTDLRNRIDGVDERIQRLIAERAHYAKEIGVIKGLTSTAEFYRPEREAQVLRKVVERNDGPLRDEEMVRLFRELMSACLAQEEPLKVAYLGPEGTFTQSAVFKHFGHSVHALAVPTIDEVFHEVESGTADFGVAPIENSSEGTVNIHTLDMFLTSPLKICGEIELRIHQHLLGGMQDLKDVKRVCSHPQSLAQCRGWLAQHLPDVEQVPVASNAEAARRARDEEGTAALAGEAAAKVYGLRILFNTVEDRDDNTTRFVVVGRKLFPASGRDKTSVLVSARETSGRPGVLLHLLGPLSKHGVNMTRIESRPSRKRKWD
jgi:chorismate mutase/prephenate dehydratase